MQIHSGEIYHVFNRGNNKQPIFFNRKNYLFFLQKIRTHLHPYCDILAYCLMPNHFHFLIYMNDKSIQPCQKSPNNNMINEFSKGLRTTLSSYTQAVNKQEKRTGALFAPKTKTVPTSGGSIINDYSIYCFIYIHKNAYKAGLVNHPKDWEFCSYPDYSGIRNGTLCNKKLAAEELDFELNEFYDFIDRPIPSEFKF